MEKLILDTSILVKLFAPDEKDYLALELLQQFSHKKLSLILLDIGLYELVNSLKLSKKATASVVFDNISDLLIIQDKIIRISEDLVQKSIFFMDKFGLTIYDSAFIAAAELEKATLLTADYKHHRKNISKNILHFKDFNL